MADVRPITGFKPTFQDRQHFSNFSAWILFLLSLCFQTNFYRCQEKQKVESVSGFWPAPGGGALVANKNKSWTENWFLISPSSGAEFSAAFSALVNILMLAKGTKGGEIYVWAIFLDSGTTIWLGQENYDNGNTEDGDYNHHDDNADDGKESGCAGGQASIWGWPIPFFSGQWCPLWLMPASSSTSQ